MLTHPTLDKLHRLRLPGMARAFIAQLEQPDSAALSFEERLGFRQDEEWIGGENKLALCTGALQACASTARTEGTGEYIDDSVVTDKVKAAVLNDPTLSAAEINVETFKGKVQLSGFVGSQADIDHAVTLTRGIEGVHSVTNGMRLK